ncbi:MAG: acyltransferase family protein [Ruminococcus sp.]|nr:acyltransferase family protein [Ruminococcus sp.]
MEENIKQIKNPPAKTGRIEYIDILRVISMLCIVMIHVVSQSFEKIPVTGYEWSTLNVYDSISRWSVPIFVMISGALFLGSNKPLKVIFHKNISRLITSFVFWSLVYATIEYIRFRKAKSAATQAIAGHYHMWFVIMIIGLYLIVPILRKIVESKELTKLFLVLALIFTAVIPTINTVLGFLSFEPVTTLKGIFTSIVADFNMRLPLGYAGYFVLGYTLNKYDISKKLEYIIYALGTAGLIFTIASTFFISIKLDKAYTGFYTYTTPNVAAMAVAVFVLFKKHYHIKNADSVLQKLIRALSKYSFGVYLVHLAVIEFIKLNLNITSVTFNPIIATPIICISTALISILISAVLNHIPVLNKYIV